MMAHRPSGRSLNIARLFQEEPDVGETHIFYLLNLEDFEEKNYTPEQKLIFSVIFRAIQDVVSWQLTGGLSASFGHPQKWILSRANDPFSFRWAVHCCEFSTHTINKIRDLATGKLPIEKIQIGKIDKMHI